MFGSTLTSWRICWRMPSWVIRTRTVPEVIWPVTQPDSSVVPRVDQPLPAHVTSPPASGSPVDVRRQTCVDVPDDAPASPGARKGISSGANATSISTAVTINVTFRWAFAGRSRSSARRQ